MDAAELNKILKAKNLSLYNAIDLFEKKHTFEKILKIILRPKSRSDSAAFRNLGNWLKEKCEDGSFNEGSIFKIVLDFALEASGPQSRNPAAVFMSILKKEIGYLK